MEKRKLLADIRCYESDIPNVDGMGIPGEFGKIYPLDFKRFAPVLRRFILKLREMQVELPGFDHLYLNFTGCIEHGEIQGSQRSIDSYHPWYRYVDIGLSAVIFREMTEDDAFRFLIRSATDALHRIYGIENLREIADEVMRKGESLSVVTKMKRNDMVSCEIVVCVLNDGKYDPFVRVRNSSGELICEFPYGRSLDQDEFIFQFGSIRLAKNSVTILPKENSLSQIYGFKKLKYVFA